jgi:hypothetical protein
MTMPINYLKQVYLQNELFSSYVALRICFLTHLVRSTENTASEVAHFQQVPYAMHIIHSLDKQSTVPNLAYGNPGIWKLGIFPTKVYL